MQLRRPIAVLLTALALFGGGATMTACGSNSTVREGTTEDEGSSDQELSDEEADRENFPDVSDLEPGQDEDGDTQDPD